MQAELTDADLALVVGGKARYHAGHRCPVCGREQLNKRRVAYPEKGCHTHRCPRCGEEWWHEDQR